MCNRPSPLLLPLFLVTTIYAHNLLFGQSTPSGSGESSHLTYLRTVSEVRLVFFATDEHNHLVEGLQKNDFAVVDDERVIREFRSFTRSDVIKLDVVVLMDSSRIRFAAYQKGDRGGSTTDFPVAVGPTRQPIGSVIRRYGSAAHLRRKLWQFVCFRSACFFAQRGTDATV